MKSVAQLQVAHSPPKFQKNKRQCHIVSFLPNISHDEQDFSSFKISRKPPRNWRVTPRLTIKQITCKRQIDILYLKEICYLSNQNEENNETIKHIAQSLQKLKGKHCLLHNCISNRFSSTKAITTYTERRNNNFFFLN